MIENRKQEIKPLKTNKFEIEHRDKSTFLAPFGIFYKILTQETKPLVFQTNNSVQVRSFHFRQR